MTLLELMVTVGIAGLVSAIAVPSYRATILRQHISAAKADLAAIGHSIERFRSSNFTPPETLDDLRGIPRLDPWGNPYRYLNFSSPVPGVKGKIRKDRNLHPLNSEFDLYSVGPDGRSVPPLTGKPSRDDVIWARDGGFVDIAANF